MPWAKRGDDADGLDGATMIAIERHLQVSEKGYTAQVDAEHADQSLALAACSYAIPDHMRKFKTDDDRNNFTPRPVLWPWPPEAWHGGDDRIRDLVRAGALIAAEIDRLRRAAS